MLFFPLKTIVSDGLNSFCNSFDASTALLTWIRSQCSKNAVQFLYDFYLLYTCHHFHIKIENKRYSLGNKILFGMIYLWSIIELLRAAHKFRAFDVCVVRYPRLPSIRSFDSQKLISPWGWITKPLKRFY